MKNILDIELPTTGKTCQIKNELSELKLGDEILIDTGQAIELARVKGIGEQRNEQLEEMQAVVLRKLTDADRRKIKEQKTKSKGMIPVCEEKIKKYGLTMKLLDADLCYDERKITFYFGTEGRVDFRELVSDLVRTFKKTIRLQQIGARDQTKVFGGFGKCGRELCCSKFLPTTDSITLDMAKDQEIIGNSNKISGSCGKLMCCLSFELESYKDLVKGMPQLGESVKTAQGDGKVISRNLLRMSYTIEKKDGQRVEVLK